MATLLKIEFSKLIKKKDILFISILLITLPLIFTLFFKYEIGGLEFNGQLQGIDYTIVIWSFLKMVFILYIVPIYIPCMLIGREVEQKSINMLLSKERRCIVLISKLIVSIVAVTIFTILFFIVGYISFKIFLTGTKYELTDSNSYTPIKIQILSLLLQWLEMIFITLVSALFNTILKSNVSLVFGFSIIALQKALQNIDTLKLYIPSSISDFNNILTVGISDINYYFIKFILVYFIYFFILSIISILIWKKRDF